MRSRLLVAALTCLVSSLPAVADAAWLQIRAGNVLFLSDATEAELRRTIERFDQFRDVIHRAFPSVVTTSPVPTVVLLFRSGRTFDQYKPSVDGHIVSDVRGYVLASDDLTYIASTAEGGSNGLRTLFHEYAHFLVANTAGPTPPWFGEGVAQVYETLALSDDRKAAIVGIPLVSHILFLQNTRLMPLSELLAVEQSLDVFDDEARRRLFYSQSWALVHYLLLGNRARASQLASYLDHVQRGDPPAAAFTAAFGATVAQIEAELQAYVRQFQFPAIGLRFADRVGERALAPASPVSDGEVQAWLSDLMARSGQPREAEGRLERLVAAEPHNARAVASLGMLHAREARRDAALPLLARATDLAPDDPVIQAAYGAALYGEAVGTLEAAIHDRAHAVLTRAAASDGDSAPVRARLGYLEMAAGNFETAQALFARALALAPSRHEYRLGLAEVLDRRGESARAAEELRLVAVRAAPETAGRARALLARLDAGATAVPVSTVPEPRVRVRIPGPGEEQALARLVQVECSGPIQAYRLEDDARVYRMFRPIGGVELRTHRSDTPPAIGCGGLPREFPAVVTYVPTGDADGRVVEGIVMALELVPDDYVNR